MKTLAEIDSIMRTIPEEYRGNWCGGEHGACACAGCVQICNRLIMTGRTIYQCDPEYIDESTIALEIYTKFKLTREEWEQAPLAIYQSAIPFNAPHARA